MTKNIFLKITVFSTIILIFGCRSVPTIYDYTMSTDLNAVADTSIDQKKYNKCYLVTEYDKKTIKGRQYESFFKDSFSAVGIEITSDKSQANCILFAAFNTKQETYSTSTPVYGQTGISSATLTPNPWGGSTISYEPSYGITGYVPTQYHIIGNSLNISAETKSGKEIWTVYVNMTDTIRTAKDVEQAIGSNAIPILIHSAAAASRTNDKRGWAYSQLELELLLQHRAKEINIGGETRLQPLTKKVPNIDAVANWNACGGETMIDVLTRWAKRTGYKLLDMGDKIRNSIVEYDQPYQGKFADVLSQYLTPKGLKPILDTSKKTLSLSENE